MKIALFVDSFILMNVFIYHLMWYGNDMEKKRGRLC